MPPRIRFAGPIAPAIAGIRQGAQVKFEADEEERLRKHRMALAQLAEKRRQANLQAGVAAMQERGRTGRQQMEGQQRMMQQHAIAAREKSNDERALEQDQQRHQLDKKLENFKLTEKQELQRQDIVQKLNDLDHSPDRFKMSDNERVQVRAGLLARLNGLSGIITPDQQHEQPQQTAEKMIVRFPDDEQKYVLKSTYRSGQWQTDLDALGAAPKAGIAQSKRIQSARDRLGFKRGGVDVTVPPDVINAWNNYNDAIDAGKEADDGTKWTVWKWERDRISARHEEARSNRKVKVLPLLREARQEIAQNEEDAHFAEIDASDRDSDAKNKARAEWDKGAKRRVSDEEAWRYIQSDPVMKDKLDEIDLKNPLPDQDPILMDGARPSGVAPGPDPTAQSAVPTDVGGQQMQGMPQGGMPQGMPQQGGMPQGMPGGMPQDQGMQGAGVPQPLPQPDEDYAAPEFATPSLQDMEPAMAETVNQFMTFSDDPDMSLSDLNIVRVEDVPEYQRLEHNVNLINQYETWQGLLMSPSAFGSNTANWPPRAKEILANLYDAMQGSAPVDVKKRATQVREPKAHGLEKSTAMPPKGWDNRGARDITADEYKYLLWLSRKQRGKARHDTLRSSIAAMSDDQKLYLQELATNDRRLSLLAFLSPD